MLTPTCSLCACLCPSCLLMSLCWEVVTMLKHYSCSLDSWRVLGRRRGWLMLVSLAPTYTLHTDLCTSFPLLTLCWEMVGILKHCSCMGRIEGDGYVIYGSECPLMPAHTQDYKYWCVLNFHHLDFVTYGHKCIQADTKVDAKHVQRALEAGASRCEGCK